jgi:hypothetical protein
MKKSIGKIISIVVILALIAAVVVEFFFWQEDKKYYEAQLDEYENVVAILMESITGNVSSLDEAKQAISDYRQEMVQLQADLDAYKAVVDEINEERMAKNKAYEEKQKAEEEAWNALSDEQRTAVNESKERGKILGYLLRNNQEYAELYIYMRDLMNRGLVELSHNEYQTYKANKTRMMEIEEEYKATLSEDDGK